MPTLLRTYPRSISRGSLCSRVIPYPDPTNAYPDLYGSELFDSAITGRVVHTTILTGSAQNVSSYTTGEVTLKAGRLYALAINSRTSISADPNIPTFSGPSVTWTQQNTQQHDTTGTSRKRITLWTCIPSSDTTAALVASFGGQTQTDIGLSIHEFSNQNATTPVPQAVGGFDDTITVQTLTITLSAFGSLQNAVFAVFGIGSVTSVPTLGAGFSPASDISTGTNNRQTAQFRDSPDTSVDMSWSVVEEIGGIAIEIAFVSNATVIAVTKALAYMVVAPHAALTKSLSYRVNRPVSAITKSLNYDIRRTPAAVTKSLAYDINSVSVVGITKGLVYDIRRTPAAITKALVYRIRRQQAAITKSLRYAVRVVGPLAKSLKYSVKRPALAITKSLKYTVKRPASAITKSLGYATRKPAAAITKSLQYATRKSSSITKTLRYLVDRPTSAITKTLKYTVRIAGAAALAKSLTYRVRKPAAAVTKSLRYSLSKNAAVTKQLRYELPRAAMMLALRYAIKSPTVFVRHLVYRVIPRRNDEWTPLNRASSSPFESSSGSSGVFTSSTTSPAAFTDMSTPQVNQWSSQTPEQNSPFEDEDIGIT